MIVRDGETDWDAMARAGWIGIVKELAVAPSVPPVISDYLETTKIPADEVSHPYRYGSLAGLSDADLFAFMMANRSLDEVVYERAEQLAAMPDFWKMEPRQNALEAIHANRPLNVRDREAFAFDVSDGKQAPEEGDLTLDDGPSGCFAPSGTFRQHLHCDRAGSFLLLASRLTPWDAIAATDRRTVFNYRKLRVSYEDARQFLQTVWFMLRARTIPSASKLQDDMGGGSTSDGRATLTLASPGDSTTTEGSRFAGWPGRFAGLSGSGDGLDQTAILNIAVRLFAREWTTRLGDQWRPEFPDTGVRYGQPPPEPSKEEIAAIHDRAAEFLRLFFAGQAPPAFAEEAVSAAIQHGFDDLREQIASIPDRLPPPTAAEIELGKLNTEIKSWVEKHGEALAGESASNRRAHGDIPALPTPGDEAVLSRLPGLDAPAARPDSEQTPEEKEAAAQRELFAPLDALYERRSDLLYIQMPEPERIIMGLRSDAPQAVRFLSARENPTALRDLLLEVPSLAEIGLARLAELDEAAAIEVLRAELEKEPEFPSSPNSLALAKLGAGPKPTPEEARFKGMIEGRETLTPENIRFALSPPSDELTMWDDYTRAFELVVPPADPQRHRFPEVDQELGRLIVEAQNGRGRIPEESIALACARREIPGTWEEIDKLSGDFNTGKTWRALGLLARSDQDENHRRFFERVNRNLTATKGSLNEMFFATWLADARECKSKLEKFATSGPRDAEGLLSSMETSVAEPVRHRFHEARRVVSIWNEEDPATRACLLIGFALHRPDHFTPETQPESWQLCREQLLAAFRPLDSAGRARVREFFAFAKLEFARRNDGFHDPERAASLLRALEQTLE